MADDKNRISIYLGPPLRALLDEASNRSGRLNSVAERYLEILADERKRLAFSTAEWCVILDANNVAFEIDHTPDWQWQWVNVMDDTDAGRAHNVDVADLAHKLRGLTLAARAALYECTLAFWSGHEPGADGNPLTLEQAFAKAAIVPTDAQSKGD